MTTIDLKRAREVADRLMDYAQVSNDTINTEAASLLRSLCDKIETDEVSILAMGRVVHAAAQSSCRSNGEPDCRCAYCLAHRFLKSALAAAGKETP